jgi:hypothetical protein
MNFFTVLTESWCNEIQDVVVNLPKNLIFSLIEFWSVKTQRSTTHFGILLVEEEVIKHLKKYTEVHVHPNVHPEELERENVINVRITVPERKEEFERFLEKIVKIPILALKTPKYVPGKNGYGFYNFIPFDFIILPAIIGFIRSFYGDSNGITAKYALRGDKSYSPHKTLTQPEGFPIYNKKIKKNKI